MILGPKLVKQCALCHGLFQELTLVSGGNFGKIGWTDGETCNWVVRIRPYDLGVCPHCGGFIKIGDQTVLGEFGGHDSDLQWHEGSGGPRNTDERLDDSGSDGRQQHPALDGLDLTQLPAFKRLGFKEWIDISGGAMGPIENEGTFRLLAWRTGNDVRRSNQSRATMRKREVKKQPPEREAPEADNMLWLFKRLGNDPYCKLIKAELLRELGDFRWAHKMLRSKLPDDCEGLQGYLNGLVDSRSSDVHVLPGGMGFPGEPRKLTPSPDDDEELST